MEIQTIGIVIGIIALIFQILTGWTAAAQTVSSIFPFFEKNKEYLKRISLGLLFIGLAIYFFPLNEFSQTETRQILLSDIRGILYQRCGDFYCAEIPAAHSAIIKISNVTIQKEQDVRFYFDGIKNAEINWNGNYSTIEDNNFSTKNILQDNYLIINAPSNDSLTFRSAKVTINGRGDPVVLSIVSFVLFVTGLLLARNRLDSTLSGFMGPDFAAKEKFRGIIKEIAEKEDKTLNKELTKSAMKEIRAQLRAHHITKKDYDYIVEYSNTVDTMTNEEFEKEFF